MSKVGLNPLTTNFSSDDPVKGNQKTKKRPGGVDQLRKPYPLGEAATRDKSVRGHPIAVGKLITPSGQAWLIRQIGDPNAKGAPGSRGGFVVEVNKKNIPIPAQFVKPFVQANGKNVLVVDTTRLPRYIQKWEQGTRLARKPELQLPSPNINMPQPNKSLGQGVILDINDKKNQSNS